MQGEGLNTPLTETDAAKADESKIIKQMMLKQSKIKMKINNNRQ